MDTHTPVQHITDPSSHNDLSDESDQADEELALVTSGPVSAHTRSKCIGARRKGDGGTRPVGDDDATVAPVTYYQHFAADHGNGWLWLGNFRRCSGPYLFLFF